MRVGEREGGENCSGCVASLFIHGAFSCRGLLVCRCPHPASRSSCDASVAKLQLVCDAMAGPAVLVQTLPVRFMFSLLFLLRRLFPRC